MTLCIYQIDLPQEAIEILNLKKAKKCNDQERIQFNSKSILYNLKTKMGNNEIDK